MHLRLPRTAVVVVALLLGLAGPLVVAPTATADAPDQTTWESDVAAVMAGSHQWLQERVAEAEPGDRLAINLDIDNTSLSTYYERGRPVRKVRNFARLADQLGIAVLFNTGRTRANLVGMRAQLESVGYDVTMICARRANERLIPGKQRCRDRFIDAGYTLVANVGNRPTDFVGGGYERAFVLPNYDLELG